MIERAFMPWLDKKKDWLPSQGRRGRGDGPRVEKMYSVSEVAGLLSVSRHTIFKWMAMDKSDRNIIPFEAWIKLPNGHIRIREWIVLKLQAGEI